MKSKGRPLIAALAFASVVAFTQSPALKADLQTRRLVGHLLPPSITSGARPFTPPNDRIQLAIRLPMQHEAELDEFLARVYDPRDALYGHYLSPARFAARFGAKEADVRAVRRYLAGLGCVLGGPHPERLTVDAECAQGVIEQAFSVQISHWLTTDNQLIRTIDQEPRVPAALPIVAIHGLTSSPRRPYFVRLEPESGAAPAAGSGPGGGLSPGDIKAAYGLGAVTQNGAGQTLAVFELDGYNVSDISTYASQFGLKAVPLQNVLIDGTSGTAGSGAPEVCLDIELMMALAPGATKIVVYEAPNTDAGVVDLYQRIANDDSARQISTSWGATELGVAAATRTSENQIFKQMAAQGQSLYAASGDSGAYDDGSSLSVDDPASQPYVTGAGGTTLTTQADHTYLKETAWWDSTRRIGGGGGISSVWPIPSWQVGAASAAAGASSSQRNVPDVALDADPSTGYAVYTGGSWAVYGGTSCSAPLWAAFTALVNQKRASGGGNPLGLAAAAIYPLARGSDYSSDWHDIIDGSTNGHYPAVTGYDLATGWGSFQAAGLLTDLGAVAPSPSPSPSPSHSPSPTPTPPPPATGCNGTQGWPRATPTGFDASAANGVSMSLPLLVGWVASRGSRRRRTPRER